MKTAIMTDTNSGINKKEADELGIFLLPMPVIVKDKTYLEGIDISLGEKKTAFAIPIIGKGSWKMIIPGYRPSRFS